MAQQEPDRQKKQRRTCGCSWSPQPLSGLWSRKDSSALRRSCVVIGSIEPFWRNTKTIFMIPPTFAPAQSCEPLKGTFLSPPLLQSSVFKKKKKRCARQLHFESDRCWKNDGGCHARAKLAIPGLHFCVQTCCM